MCYKNTTPSRASNTERQPAERAQSSCNPQAPACKQASRFETIASWSFRLEPLRLGKLRQCFRLRHGLEANVGSRMHDDDPGKNNRNEGLVCLAVAKIRGRSGRHAKSRLTANLAGVVSEQRLCRGQPVLARCCRKRNVTADADARNAPAIQVHDRNVGIGNADQRIGPIHINQRAPRQRLDQIRCELRTRCTTAAQDQKRQQEAAELGGTPQCQHCPRPRPQSYIRICERLSVRAMSVQLLLYIAPAGIRGASDVYFTRLYRLNAEPRPPATSGLEVTNSSSVSLSMVRSCDWPWAFG